MVVGLPSCVQEPREPQDGVTVTEAPHGPPRQHSFLKVLLKVNMKLVPLLPYLGDRDQTFRRGSLVLQDTGIALATKCQDLTGSSSEGSRS